MGQPGVIYGLHVGDGRIRYVGQTILGQGYRLTQHLKDARKGLHLPVHNWIRKHDYQIESLTLEQQAETDRPALHQLERDWIARLRAAGQSDLNLTDGGEGQLGWIPTAANRKTMSDAQKGRPNTSFKGRKHTEAAKRLISEKAKGRVVSAERRAQMSINSKGKFANENHWRTKLKNVDVIEIKRRIAAGQGNREIAADYNIGASTVWNIRKGNSWREVA